MSEIQDLKQAVELARQAVIAAKKEVEEAKNALAEAENEGNEEKSLKLYRNAVKDKEKLLKKDEDLLKKNAESSSVDFHRVVDGCKYKSAVAKALAKVVPKSASVGSMSGDTPTSQKANTALNATEFNAEQFCDLAGVQDVLAPVAGQELIDIVNGASHLVDRLGPQREIPLHAALNQIMKVAADALSLNRAVYGEKKKGDNTTETGSRPPARQPDGAFSHHMADRTNNIAVLTKCEQRGLFLSIEYKAVLDSSRAQKAHTQILQDWALCAEPYARFRKPIVHLISDLRRWYACVAYVDEYDAVRTTSWNLGQLYVDVAVGGNIDRIVDVDVLNRILFVLKVASVVEEKEGNSTFWKNIDKLENAMIGNDGNGWTKLTVHVCRFLSSACAGQAVLECEVTSAPLFEDDVPSPAVLATPERVAIKFFDKDNNKERYESERAALQWLKDAKGASDYFVLAHNLDEIWVKGSACFIVMDAVGVSLDRVCLCHERVRDLVVGALKNIKDALDWLGKWSLAFGDVHPGNIVFVDGTLPLQGQSGQVDGNVSAGTAKLIDVESLSATSSDAVVRLEGSAYRVRWWGDVEARLEKPNDMRRSFDRLSLGAVMWHTKQHGQWTNTTYSAPCAFHKIGDMMTVDLLNEMVEQVGGIDEEHVKAWEEIIVEKRKKEIQRQQEESLRLGDGDIAGCKTPKRRDH